MRIGIDGRYAFRRERRGIGEYVAQLLLQYDNRYDENEYVVYVDRQAEVSAMRLSSKFRVVRLDVANPLLFEEVFLPLAAARDNLGVLHLTSNYGPTWASCPTVYTVQDLIEFLRGEIGPWQIDWRHRMGRAIRQRTLPIQIRQARMVIVPSQATERDIVRVIGISDQKIRVIPYGAPAISPAEDTERLRVELRGRGYSVPDRYFLMFAAMDPRKNSTLAIEAFRRVASEFDAVELWMIGIEDLKGYPRCNVPRVRRFGYLPRADVVDLLRAASAFVFPSRYEGFGFPALEAMKAGVPVLASNSSSVPEVVGDTAFTFCPDDVEQLARGMREVLTGTREVEARRLAALRRAQLFDWRRTAAEHLDVYQTAGRVLP